MKTLLFDLDGTMYRGTQIIESAYMRKFNEAGKHAWDIVAGDEWPIAGEGVTDVELTHISI